jgi:ABC-type branched-subunit amino acid transport system substrate-binding protein
MVLKRNLLVGAAALLIAAAGCSSSSKSSSSSTTASSTTTTSGSSSSPTSAAAPSGGRTYTVGVLTDITGPASTNAFTIPKGVQAGIGLAATEGYHIKYVVADTGSSPAGVLTAAERLVEQDHVFAVIANSGFTFAAAPYLKSKGIPVIGAAVDASEWITDANMFSIIGTADYTKVYSTPGLFFKMVGVTNLGVLGYSISPSSSLSAKATAVAAEQEGIKVGYLNANFPFGGTNTGPAVLAMKSAGVNGFQGAVETNTVFAIINNLRAAGVTVKALMSTGYGGDLVQGGPGAVQSAQGVYFLTSFEPVEMNTSATQQFQMYLKTSAGVTTAPTFAEYQGYVSIDAFVQGLKAAGTNPTQASLINAMLGMTNYAGAGLWGTHTLSFALSSRGQASGIDNCYWIAQFEGTTFHLVSGMEPLCGAVVPGKTVSLSS